MLDSRDRSGAGRSTCATSSRCIRQTSPSFDERAYGFANLVDLLRAAHKDGLVRVDRDRQGVIRVFQGSLAAPSTGG